jgi:hypothetical protein
VGCDLQRENVSRGPAGGPIAPIDRAPGRGTGDGISRELQSLTGSGDIPGHGTQAGGSLMDLDRVLAPNLTDGSGAPCFDLLNVAPDSANSLRPFAARTRGGGITGQLSDVLALKAACRITPPTGNTPAQTLSPALDLGI